MLSSYARARGLLGAGALAALAGCTAIGNVLEGDKVDYKSGGAAVHTTGLEVPPDLTQLGPGKYNNASGSVSASALQNGTAPAVARAVANPSVAASAVGDVHLERQGNERWLSTTQPPEVVYPLVKAFWKDSGFNLIQDRPEAGVMETDWAENRAKIPGDIIRNTIGKVIDAAYSTGTLDKFRIRIERTTTGTDIYVSQRGLEEVYVGQQKESTSWRPRPNDPLLEAEFLSRLMIRLGARDEQGKPILATATSSKGTPSGPVRARLVAGSATPTLQLDDSFDRAWRRVGIALDRSGFTVEDRDRAQGIYFVRYVDPSFAGRGDPNIFSRAFNAVLGRKDENGLAKYRVKVTGEGTANSTVAVLDSAGKADRGDATTRIASLLLEDLK